MNVDFFTKSPETLFVFEYGGEKRELGAAEYRAFELKQSADLGFQPAKDELEKLSDGG